ncbi:hypothetical protein L1987_45710 [Smallanthus sonchifolius]|uniref:Uncharacterized protein n=1 Tax=Smallanthus sonchifolius TaxID=185202 RepID=A0ACB9FXV2_9ASTR|nr:hypothetical protein L1987_45710 [Smallanthus sonchifolius]
MRHPTPSDSQPPHTERQKPQVVSEMPVLERRKVGWRSTRRCRRIESGGDRSRRELRPVCPLGGNGNESQIDDSSADIREFVKADEFCDVDNLTVGLGFSDKGLINSDVSQPDDYKPVSPVSKNCFDKIVHVAKDFIPTKFMKEDDDSSDELKIKKEDAIHIHSTEKLPSPWNMDKVDERKKNKKVEETTQAANFKKPFKACFKCVHERHLIKHFKKVDETSSSRFKRHGSEGKGNKNCFSGSKSTRNNYLNDHKKNYSSRSPYVKPVSHDSKITIKKDSPRYSHITVSKSPRLSKYRQTYLAKALASELKQKIVSNLNIS